MKKKIAVLGTALMIAAALTACGGRDTKTETTVPVETTVPAETLAPAETRAEGSEAAEPGSQANEPSEEGETLSAEDMKTFAKHIQDAVAAKNLEALADLCYYPVYLSTGEGEGEEIKNRDDFIMLEQDKIFTDGLMKEIADTDPDSLEQFGAGVIMGAENSITFNSVDGNAVITSIILQ